MINPKDIRILHNYEVTIQYGAMSYAGNVVYLRHPVDGYDEKSFDELDKTFRELIDGNKNMSVVSHNAELLDTKDKIMRWDVCLQKQHQYVAYCRKYWFDDTHRISVDIRLLGTLLCEKVTPTNRLLGDNEYIDYEGVNIIFNVGLKNKFEMLQEHPHVHGIFCYVNEKTNQLYLLYRFAPKSQFVKVIYNNEVNTIQLTFSETQNAYSIFESEVESLKSGEDFRRLCLYQDKALFENAKQASLRESSKHNEQIFRDFEKYLSPIFEI